MEQINISRDHIAMEAMKVLLARCEMPYFTIWGKIKRALGLSYTTFWVTNYAQNLAKHSYRIADAMIEWRSKGENNKTEEQE